MGQDIRLVSLELVEGAAILARLQGPRRTQSASWQALVSSLGNCPRVAVQTRGHKHVQKLSTHVVSADVVAVGQLELGESAREQRELSPSNAVVSTRCTRVSFSDEGTIRACSATLCKLARCLHACALSPPAHPIRAHWVSNMRVLPCRQHTMCYFRQAQQENFRFIFPRTNSGAVFSNLQRDMQSRRSPRNHLPLYGRATGGLASSPRSPHSSGRIVLKGVWGTCLRRCDD